MADPAWELIRLEYPALAGRTFLNTATYGQLSRRTTEAVQAHFRHRDDRACSDFLEWFDDMDNIRAGIARLIHATPEDIAFAGNASTALAWLINGWEWRRGDRIFALKGDFPNNLYYPALLSHLGVEFLELALDELCESIDERVRVVLLSTVNYATGFRPSLEQVRSRLDLFSGLLYVDGTQSIGALTFDVRAARPDMLAVDAYKWMLSPNGAGFVYVAPELRSKLRPSVIGWRSDRGWRGVDELLQHGAPEFPEAAERYEGGMLNFPNLYGMGASVNTMLGIGPENIERRVRQLASLCRETLLEAGGEIEHTDSCILAARFPNRDASRLASELAARNIMAAARHGRLRVSMHFYNNEQDLENLRTALQR